jgi:hypothetical protein
LTPEDHNKALGIAHIAYGAFHLLLITVMMLFFIGMGAAMAEGAKDFPPLLIFGLVFGLMFIFYLAITLPSFVAGYALLKRRSWAKTASIIAAIIESMGFPFGTALCVYSLWFCFGDVGKSLYDNSYNRTAQRISELNKAPEYVPPMAPKREGDEATVYARMRQPPDWRD